MKTPNLLLALGACTLSACAPMAAQRTTTVLPESVVMGRHLTISYAVAQAVGNDRGCGQIDSAVLQPNDYNYFYFSPGVVHSPRDQAVDAFIRNGHRLCQYPDTSLFDHQTGTVLVAHFRPQDKAQPAILFLTGRDTMFASTAFWTAAEGASLTDNPWRKAFFCIASTGPDGGVLDGTTNCFLTPDEPSKPRVTQGAPGLRGRQP